VANQVLHMRPLASRALFVRPNLSVAFDAAHTPLGVQSERLFKSDGKPIVLIPQLANMF
jgi:hypothetical protein